MSTSDNSENKRAQCETNWHPKQFTDEEIAAALIKTKGLQYLAADLLGMSPEHMSKRIRMSPYLQMIRDQGAERRLDIAEYNLAEMTEAKNLGSICFLLKTRGKHRGYAETSTLVVSPEQAKQIEALMRQTGAKQAEYQEALKQAETSSNAE